MYILCVAVVAASPSGFRRADDIPIGRSLSDSFEGSEEGSDEGPFRARPRFLRILDAHRAYSDSMDGMRKKGMSKKDVMAEYAAGLLKLTAVKKAELDELNRETLENIGNTYVKVSDLSEVDKRFGNFFESMEILYKALLEQYKEEDA